MDDDKRPTFSGTSCCGTFGFFLRHSTREICRRMCYFAISVLSCYLAITVALVANTVISNAPLLFLRMSEVSEGEIDMKLTPEADTTIYPRFFNSTLMSQLTSGYAELTPRLTFDSTTAFLGEQYSNLTLMVLDTQREADMGIGRKYTGKVLEEGECAVHKNLANYLGLSIGTTFYLNVKMESYMEIVSSLNDTTQIYVPIMEPSYSMSCRVGIIYKSLEGKVPSGDDDSYFYMEFKHFLKQVANSTRANGAALDTKLARTIRELDPYSIASQVLANNPDRMTVYKDSDYDNVQQKMTAFAAGILDRVGFFPVDTDMPILDDLKTLSMAGVFLGIILNLVVIILAAISSYLIYSLLMISFDTRQFELGVFRLIGLKKYALCALVIVQAMLFVLPAVIVGICTSFVYLRIVSNILESSIQFSFTPVPTLGAFIWGIAVGLVVPLLASLIPIRTILTRTLGESMDTTHSKSLGVHITIESAQNGTSWSLVAFGLIIICFGIAIYYLLPLALLSQNYQLMLWLMLVVLLAMFIGLIMLALNLQHFLDLFIVHILLFYEATYMKLLILKNLVAHRIRNGRTGIIFATVIGFLVFIVVGYTMELDNSQLIMLQEHGAYLDVTAKKEAVFPFDFVVAVEEMLAKNNATVQSYSWIPQQLTLNSHMQMKAAWLSDYGRLYKYSVLPYAIPPIFSSVGNTQFLSVFSENASSGLSLTEQLYTPRGSQALLTGSFIERELGVSAKDMDSTFLFLFERAGLDAAYETRAQALLNSFPGFAMSRLTSGATQPVLMSYPVFMELTNTTSISLVEFKYLEVKVYHDNSGSYDQIYDKLSNIVNQKGLNATVWSYSNDSDNINSIKRFLDIIFYVIIGLFMLLFVFSLVSSMTANVLEQSKELAVIRAVGVTQWRVSILYMYEAFVLVLSSCAIGCIIGTLVGFTLCLQMTLYSNLPVTFSFPWVHLLVIIGCSILCAGISAVSPTLFVMRQSIGLLAKQ